jgi:antitoxin HicB
MAETSYRVLLNPDEEDGGYNVVIPAFPHAHTQGDTVEDALANAREVIELELEYLAEKGLPLPDGDGDAISLCVVLRSGT